VCRLSIGGAGLCPPRGSVKISLVVKSLANAGRHFAFSYEDRNNCQNIVVSEVPQNYIDYYQLVFVLYQSINPTLISITPISKQFL